MGVPGNRRQELIDFGYAADGADAARLALTAGVDIEMAVQIPSPASTYANNGPQLLSSGKITMAQLNNAVRPAGGSVQVRADITNSGSVSGDDVAQLYIHESDTSILQPVSRLEGFQRLTLAPGQTQTVSFRLTPQNLGFYNAQGKFVVEPGPFDVWVGDSSDGGLHSTFTVQ